MKYVRRIIAVIIISLSFITTVYADDTKTYTVIDYNEDSTKTIYASDNYDDAYNFYISNYYSYTNLCLLENDKTLFMEYGTLYINSDEDEVTYYSISDECDKSLINFNDYELVYLDDFGDTIEFALKGDVGIISKDEVVLHPFTTHSVSYYDNDDGSLVYHVSSSINNYYKYNLKIDVYPDMLDKDSKYYSNDGHYFYSDFYTMCNDLSLLAGTGPQNSINKDNPYYNYYAYLPSRSYSNYSSSDFNSFFTDKLGIKGRLNSYSDFDGDGANDVINRSEYYGNMKSFISSEKIYGVNALTSLAWSSEESAFGKSKNSYLNSNVYNHSALIGKEIENNKYSSINSSIYSHVSNYVSKKYCDEFSSLYVGSHIGDYMSGIASVYSHDPLFGDKVASKAYFYDLALGLKDRNSYTIGITSRGISLYYYSDLSWSFNTIKEIDNYSFIILDEGDDYYKVQCDYARNQTGEYNPEECIAYVKKDRVDRVIKGNLDQISYQKYTVDTGDNKRVNLYSLNEFDVINDFIYKDIEGVEVTNYKLENDIYVPTTKKIKEIELKDSNNIYTNINGPVISNEKIMVTYDDGTSSTKNICGDYIASCSNSNDVINMKISYNGVSQNVAISEHVAHSNDDPLNVVDDTTYLNYSFKDVENIDNSYDTSNVNDITTYIRENEYDLNVSGAYPSFVYHSTDKLSNIINTYYFDIEQVRDDKSINSIVSNYGLEFVDAFDISISRCFYKINLVSPVAMQVKIPELDKNSIYTVYRKEKNGDIVKIPTNFSNNYVKFLAADDGKYYIYRLKSASLYDVDDNRYTTNIDNNGADYYAVAKEGIELFSITALGYLLCVVYVLCKRKEERNWKDFKRLLQQVESVREEKQNN